MTLSRLIAKNVLRNKRRTGLTVVSIGFSLFLLIALWTVLNNLTNPPENEASIRRLAVRRSTSLAEQMPVAYGEKIKKIPHVQLVDPLQWFGGYYREEKNMLATLTTDPVMFPQIFPEMVASPETLAAFQRDRRGAIVGRQLMKQFGWKTGDTVTIMGNILPANLEVHLCGDYTNPDAENNFFVRWDYVKEATGDTGQISSFWVLVDAKENVPKIIDAIDAMFRNTNAETKTETEKAFQLGFVSMLGNIRLIIGSIALVVVFTMLLVVTSTMAMTIRERLREVAIMKSIGFTKRHIFALILGEGVAIAMAGWLMAFAIAVSMRFVDTNAATMGFVPKFNPAPWIYFSTLGIGLGIGAVAGLIPGIQASRLTILEAMRRLE
jgi:putative ABC transport system permease protein